MRESIYLRLSLTGDAAPEWVIRNTLDHDTPSRQIESGSWDEALAACVDRRIVAIAPAEVCLLTSVNLPIKQQQKLLQAIPFALEDHLAEDVDALHFAVGSRLPSTDVPVVVVARKHMQFWISQFANVGLEPDRLYAETLCLPWTTRAGPPTKSAIVEQERMVVRHAQNEGFVASVDEFSQLFDAEQLELDEFNRLSVYADGTATTPKEQWSVPIQEEFSEEPAFSLLARSSEAQPNINLLQGAFSPASELANLLQPLKISAALAAGLVIALTVTQYLENQRLSAQLDQLNSSLQSEFQETFPGLTRIVDLERQATSELQKLRGRGSGSNALVELLAETSSAFNGATNVELRSVQLRDSAVFLNLQTKALKDLENLRGQLRKLELIEHEVQSANSNESGVQVRLVVKRKSA